MAWTNDMARVEALRILLTHEKEALRTWTAAGEKEEIKQSAQTVADVLNELTKLAFRDPTERPASSTQ